MFRFLPGRLAATRLHHAWLLGLLGMPRGWLATPRAVLEGRRSFFHRSGCLAFQSKFQHLLREYFTNVHDEILQLTELGAPPRPGGPPKAVREVFRDPLDVTADFFYLLTPFLGARHPWPPVELVANVSTNFHAESTIPASWLANHVPHPRRRGLLWLP